MPINEQYSINISEKPNQVNEVMVIEHPEYPNRPIPLRNKLSGGRADDKETESVANILRAECFSGQLYDHRMVSSNYSYFTEWAKTKIQVMAANDIDDARVLAQRYIVPLLNKLTETLVEASIFQLDKINAKDKLYIAYKENNWDLELLVKLIVRIKQLEQGRASTFFKILSEPGRTITQAFHWLDHPEEYNSEQNKLKRETEQAEIKKDAALQEICNDLVKLGYDRTEATLIVNKTYSLFYEQRKEALKTSQTNQSQYYKEDVKPVSDATERTQALFRKAKEQIDVLSHQVPTADRYLAHKMFMEIIKSSTFNSLYKYSFKGSSQEEGFNEIAAFILKGIIAIIKKLGLSQENYPQKIAELEKEKNQLFAELKNLKEEHDKLKRTVTSLESINKEQEETIRRQSALIEHLRSQLSGELKVQHAETSTDPDITPDLSLDEPQDKLDPERIKLIKKAMLARIEAYRQQVHCGLTYEEYKRVNENQTPDEVFENIPVIKEALAEGRLGAKHLFSAFKILCKEGWQQNTPDENPVKHFGYHWLSMTQNTIGLLRTLPLVFGDNFDPTNPVKTPDNWDGPLSLSQLLIYFALRTGATPDNCTDFGLNKNDPKFGSKNKDGAYQSLAEVYFNEGDVATVPYSKKIPKNAKEEIAKLEAKDLKNTVSEATFFGKTLSKSQSKKEQVDEAVQFCHQHNPFSYKRQ